MWLNSMLKPHRGRGPLLLAVALTIFVIVFFLSCRDLQERVSVFSGHRYIGHAFGAVEGETYTNSYEAFIENYRRGRRVFEVDFSLTADGKVVCFHSDMESRRGLDRKVWETGHAEFMEKKILGKFTPMDLGDLIRIMRENDDIYIVTDTKCRFGVFMEIFMDEMRKADPGMLERVIPQIYGERDYHVLREFFPFREIIYTLYRTRAGDKDVADFIRDKDDITAVTVSAGRFTKELSRAVGEMDKYLFVHTLNDGAVIKLFRGMGAYGFYTDSYFPDG
jgi:glycerophosphoryl diester phosphodiesterase